MGALHLQFVDMGPAGGRLYLVPSLRGPHDVCPEHHRVVPGISFRRARREDVSVLRPWRGHRAQGHPGVHLSGNLAAFLAESAPPRPHRRLVPERNGGRAENGSGHVLKDAEGAGPDLHRARPRSPDPSRYLTLRIITPVMQRLDLVLSVTATAMLLPLMVL